MDNQPHSIDETLDKMVSELWYDTNPKFKLYVQSFKAWHLAEVKRIVAATKIDTLENIMVRGKPAYIITDFDDMPIEYKTFGMVLRKSIDEIKRESEGNNANS